LYAGTNTQHVRKSVYKYWGDRKNLYPGTNTPHVRKVFANFGETGKICTQAKTRNTSGKVFINFGETGEICTQAQPGVKFYWIQNYSVQGKNLVFAIVKFKFWYSLP
jgi:hypothetical protein